jgi:hypothetical protein
MLDVRRLMNCLALNIMPHAQQQEDLLMLWGLEKHC